MCFFTWVRQNIDISLVTRPSVALMRLTSHIVATCRYLVRRLLCSRRCGYGTTAVSQFSTYHTYRHVSQQCTNSSTSSSSWYESGGECTRYGSNLSEHRKRRKKRRTVHKSTSVVIRVRIPVRMMSETRSTQEATHGGYATNYAMHHQSNSAIL